MDIVHIIAVQSQSMSSGSSPDDDLSESVMSSKYLSTSISLSVDVEDSGGTRTGLKLDKYAHTNRIWLASLASDIGRVCFNILYVLILPIALCTWIHKDAIRLPS